MKYYSSKTRLLAVLQILSTKPQTAQTILDKLAKRFGIEAKRETIYDDIAALTFFYNIQYSNEKNNRGYYICAN